MPSSTTRAAGQVITASDINGLAVVANAGESGASAAQTAANNAQATANAAYVKPAAGIADTDLTAARQSLLAKMVVFTSGIVRPAGAPLVIFTGADPGTASVAGDLWVGDLAP